MSFAERFWSKVDFSGAAAGSSCWEWTGWQDSDGYGSISREGKSTRTHRASYELHVGPIPDGLFVLHACDNPSCVRPEHLFLGTQLENVRDCNAKGRLARGDRHGKRLHPESCLRGGNHWSRLHPERLARGDRNGARLHPERVPRGEGNGNAKLTAEQVEEIRATWRARKGTHWGRAALAKKFGVSIDAVSLVALGKTWKQQS